MICPDKLVGIDSETELIKNKYEWPDVVIAGFCSGNECQLVTWEHLPEYLPKFLTLNPTVKMVFFNLPFDVNVMGRDILLPELDKDGRMMELLINYRIYKASTEGWFSSKTTLDSLAKGTLGVSLDKTDGTRTSYTRGMTFTERHFTYLVEDCAATYLCGLAYNNMPTETDQARASFVLSEISHNGMLVDEEFRKETCRLIYEQQPELAMTLKSFGFRIKQDTDDMKAIDRFKRIGQLLNIPDLDYALDGVDKVQDGLWWVFAAALYGLLSDPAKRLPSEAADLYRAITHMLVSGEPDFSSKGKKDAKEMVARAKSFLAEKLAEFDCDACVVGVGEIKPRSVKPAMTLCEKLVETLMSGALASVGIEAAQELFKDEHEYFLGWLNTGVKPLSPTAFIQNHLKNLMKNNPELRFPYTDSATKNVRQLQKDCAKKGTIPTLEQLEEVEKFQCKGSDMWMLSDLGISDPFLDAYVAYKHNEKMLSTYLSDKYLDGDGRVHPRFDPFKITGRTGCSGPNLQNLPSTEADHRLREQYIPPKGHVFCSCDYGQEEIVTLAATLKAWYGHSVMADVVNAGVDIHAFFALNRDKALNDVDIMNMTEPVIQIIKERGAPYKEDPIKKKKRKSSKAGNFGIPGGMQGETLYLSCRRQGAEVTREEAEQLVEDWKATFPETRAYFNPAKDVLVDSSKFEGRKGKKEDDDDDDMMEDASAEDERGEQVQTFRAVNLLGMVRAQASRNSALNYPFQSLAGVITKRGMWKVFKDSLKHGYRLVNMIHDELIAEIPEEIASEVAFRMEKLMVEASNETIPGMLMKAEAALMRRWSKAAEPAYDEKGNLIPFEDKVVKKD